MPGFFVFHTRTDRCPSLTDPWRSFLSPSPDLCSQPVPTLHVDPPRESDIRCAATSTSAQDGKKILVSAEFAGLLSKAALPRIYTHVEYIQSPRLTIKQQELAL